MRHGRGGEHVLAHGGGAVPVAPGEEHHRGAGAAQLAGGVGSVCVAELVAGRVDRRRGLVVTGVLERVGQPLMQFRGGVRQ